MEDFKYYKIKSEIESFLKNYKYTEQMADDKKAIVYVLDAEAITFLKHRKKELELEYSHIPALSKKYNINNIIKIINWDKPCHSFRTLVAYNWRQINDNDKVFDILEKEFEKFFNSKKFKIKRKLKNKEVTEDYQQEVIRQINLEYLEAKPKLDFMLKNKDNITACISEYKIRKVYPRIDYIINKKRQTAVCLKTTTLNGIWYEVLDEDLQKKSNNLLVDFLSKAENPFGFVYYTMNESEKNE